MRRPFALAIAFLLVAVCARADEAIPAETVTAVKHATVFVKVEGDKWKASGSGFVVFADKDSVLIATNYHVVALPENERKRLAPADLVKSLKVPTVTAIFDGGTKTELASKAEVIAADQENDLAILKVTGLKDPPAPIAYANPPKLAETMQVYTFGYPFGQALATGKGAPAITVGKGSISSLRLNDEGELTVVQIDGALNPGNSGGPVVDSKGKLVGVAVATIRNGQGIGFAIPADELGKLMKGRLDGYQLTASKAADGKLTLKAEVGVIDPTSAVRGVTLHYLVVPPKGAKPKAGEAIEKQTGAKKVTLKVAGGIATGEIALDAKEAEGDIFVQAVPDGGAGSSGSSRTRSFALLLPKNANDTVVLGTTGSAPQGAGAGEAPAPAGWKEYTATNKTFMVWLPEKGNVSEKTRTSGRPPGPRLSFNAVVVEAPKGPTYIVEQVIISPPNHKLDRDDIIAMLRDVAIGEGAGAKVTRETDAKMGKFPGKEFLIERGNDATRARAFVIGSSIYFLRVMGTRDQVEAADAATFLDSCRLQVVKIPQPTPGAVIAGGAPIDTEFKDAVPEKGALVGLELSTTKVGALTLVKAVRGVFRVGDKESFGEWHGAPAAEAEKDAVRVVAKPGYAIGALNVRGAGIGIYGLSVTFMKIADGKLDTKDNYESEWLGGKDGPGVALTTVGGKGEAALALMGKTNARGTSGIGLLYKDTGPPKVVNRGPRIQGGGDQEFRDVAPTDGALVGLEVGLGKFFNNDVVRAVRPIYRVGEKDSLGEQYGTELTKVVKAVAKPGYAVGAIRVKTGLGIDGVGITFMKIVDGKLDPKDSYESEWLGGMGGGPPVTIGGDGTLVVGLLGRGNEKDVLGLGLIYTDTNKPNLDGAWPKGVPSKIQGGGGDREFREAGADGSFLVGVEVGVGRFFDNPVVRSVRPVFRTGDKDTTGEWHGPTDEKNVKETVKVIAKPGYAVGAITVKTGLGIDGLSITFMKIVDGKLDPEDGYESDWIGGQGGGGKVTIGEGKQPVIGLTGKARADTLSGLGLLFPPAKK